MKKTLLSLGLAAALVVPAGAAYAQNTDDVADDATVTCPMVEGEQSQFGFGSQSRARLGVDAPYGEPGDCVLGGDGPIQAQEHKQLRAADQSRVAGRDLRAGARHQSRVGEAGPLGSPEDCPFDGDGPADGSGQRFGRS